MPQKKSPAKKKTAPSKQGSRPRSPASKNPARKVAEKAAKKAATPKASASKKAAKPKAAAKKAASKAASPSRLKASDFVKRPSHTPAIFKPASKRPINILFTLDEVREVLRKREAEEQALAKAGKEAAKQAVKATGQPRVDDIPTRNSRHHAASIEDILGLTGPGSRGGQDNVPKKFRKYYDLLTQLRNEVREELNLHSNDTLKRSQKEDAGDIAISVDAGTDNFDRDFALSLLSCEQEALNEIEAAIQRIHKGNYGVCEQTGEPISDERLEAVPFTRFSVEGQKEHEMNARKRVSRAGAFLNESSGDKITFGDDDGDN